MATFSCDTSGTVNIKLNSKYQARITCDEYPDVRAGSNGIVTTKVESQSGNNYYISFTGVAVGDVGIYIFGTKAFVCHIYNDNVPFNCDTVNTTVNIEQGNKYQARITCAQVPNVVAGTGGIVSITRASNTGNDYYFAFTGIAPGETGIYINGNTTKTFTCKVVAGSGGTNYQWPTISQRITQSYSSGHPALDIGASTAGKDGDPIYAFADGKVKNVYTWSPSQGTSGNASMGNCVFIHHNNPKSNVGGAFLRTMYMHMNATPLVTVGQSVSKGDIIGYMGTTGNSTGIHLHFSLQADNSRFSPDSSLNYWVDGNWVDPTNYFTFA